MWDQRNLTLFRRMVNVSTSGQPPQRQRPFLLTGNLHLPVAIASLLDAAVITVVSTPYPAVRCINSFLTSTSVGLSAIGAKLLG